MNTQMDSQGAEQDDMIIVDVVAETQGVSQVSIGSDVEMEGQVPAKKCLTPLLDAAATNAHLSLPPRP